MFIKKPERFFLVFLCKIIARLPLRMHNRNLASINHSAKKIWVESLKLCCGLLRSGACCKALLVRANTTQFVHALQMQWEIFVWLKEKKGVQWHTHTPMCGTDFELFNHCDALKRHHKLLKLTGGGSMAIATVKWKFQFASKLFLSDMQFLIFLHLLSLVVLIVLSLTATLCHHHCSLLFFLTLKHTWCNH